MLFKYPLDYCNVLAGTLGWVQSHIVIGSIAVFIKNVHPLFHWFVRRLCDHVLHHAYYL
ncbi:hypothetical protein [Flagellimonas aurea]|uniref:hypothetical protein n=1 Tax=Flagellimonas aurea TaxID=2915619 RepID=UPI003AAAA30A